MFQRYEMVAPVLVERLQQNGFFDLPHNIRPNFGGACRRRTVNSIVQPRDNFFIRNAFFVRPVRKRDVEIVNLADLFAKTIHVPLIGIGFRRHIAGHQIVNNLVAHVAYIVVDGLGAHEINTLLEHHFALFVHHIIIFQNIFANVEIARLNLLLRAFQCFVDPWMHNGFAVFEAQPLQHAIHTVGAENPHQIVFQAEEKTRQTRIALTPRPPAQLIVNAAAFMAFCADDAKTACLKRLFFQRRNFRLNVLFARVACRAVKIFQFLVQPHVEIAAKLNIRAASGHIGGNRDRTRHAGQADNLRFLFVIARVQYIMFDFFVLQCRRQSLGFFNACCAHQNRLTARLALSHEFNDGVIFFRRRAVNCIVFIEPRNIRIGRNFNYVEPVNIHEFFGLCQRRAGHARQLVIKAEIILKCHGGESLVFRLDGGAFLGLQCLMQAV